MPWSGDTFTRSNGVFTGSGIWTNDRDAGVKIRSDRHDTHDQDLADGINASLKKDGGNAATADLPMGGFKHTNVDDATARNQYSAVGQIQDGELVYGAVTGTVDAIAISLTPDLTAYAAGQQFTFVATGANTGAVTLDVDGVGAKSVTKNGTDALVAGDIPSGAMVSVLYDGTQFQLISGVPNAVLTSGNQTIAGDKTFSDETTFSDRMTVNHAIDGAARQDIASASTVDLDAATSNYVRITGTTTITAFTLSDGHWRDVVFSGALTLTDNAAIILPGNANITTKAGDTMRIFGEAAGVVRVVNYTPEGGKFAGTQYFTSGSSYSKPANLDFVVVEVIGAGGAGGGSTTNGGGGGGGGGGTAIEKIAAGSLSASETVTVGAGASAPGAGASGTGGGTSSFGAHCSATGGGGGTAAGAGGAGGAGSGGDLNMVGGDGGAGHEDNAAGVGTGGIGGSSTKGGGGGSATGAVDGSAGNNYGGGGGGSGYGGGDRFGSAGADGLVIVHEYVR